jgi:hypothetical protein
MDTAKRKIAAINRRFEVFFLDFLNISQNIQQKLKGILEDNEKRPQLRSFLHIKPAFVSF